MTVLATKDDYVRIKELLIEFEGMIRKFKVDSDVHANIIRRYDEVLSEKASRVNFLELEELIRR
jgi:hypothetical protein